jgi:hypothetical protein
MSNVLIAGPDRGLRAELEAAGASVGTVSGVVTRERLLDAGVEGVELFVLTDVTEATSIPIVVEANPDATVVVYSPDSMPEFVRGQVDLALDPAILPAAAVAEELLGN